MAGPHPAVAATRVAVREQLGMPGAEALPDNSLVLVACSGGADSLALAAAAAHEAPRRGLRAGAVVVDHGLQEGSEGIAERAAQQCRDLGLDPVVIERVDVDPLGRGVEAGARAARYEALERVADETHAALVLVGHTRDDQAEQVLLGLSRGSGARSLSGMPRRRERIARPFLGIPRATTEAACAAYGLDVWHDPHNEDPAYLRVRVRTLMSSLEDGLGPGFGAALARSADLLREDADLLEELAREARATLGGASHDPLGSKLSVAVDELHRLPRPLRTRVLRQLAIEAGAPPGSLGALHVESLDALLTSWHGQGPLHIPGPVHVSRADGRLTFAHGGSGRQGDGPAADG